jgi:hypothetical protein
MTLKAEIDWYHVGFTTGASAPDYVGTGVDVTSATRVDDAGGGHFTARYGRDQTSAIAPTVAGSGSLVLDNKDRRFSPRNIGSALYGHIKPARPVRVTRTVDTGEFGDLFSDIFDGGLETFTLLGGRTDDNPLNPDVESKTVAVSIVDELAYFRGIQISTPLYSGIRTGQAIGYILDACGFPTALRDLDAGATVIPWWWEDGEDALTALDKVLRSEGPPAMLTMGVNGEVIFKDRHHRLTEPASTTSQDTWATDGGAEPVMNTPFSVDEAWRNIINTGLISVDVRTAQDVDAVWTLESPVAFTASETKTFIAESTEPFYNAIAPVAGTDYELTAGSISTVTLSRTSGASTMITITAGAGGAQIASLQLRANPVRTAYTVQVTASDATSIADYGQRSFPHDLPWCNQYDAEAILNLTIQERAQPLPIVSASFLIGTNAYRAAVILSRNLSDRLTVIEPQSALNIDFYLESIAHDLTAEFDHVVEAGLEAVPPATAVTPSNIFLIGGGVGHQIGDGVLAY